MEVKLGGNYQTVSGLPIRIYAIDGHGEFCVHGAILTCNEWISHTWSIKGNDLSNSISEYDLVELYEEMETKKLPVIMPGKKLVKANIEISTLSQCLTALVDGYVLEAKAGGFHFVDGDNFAYFGNIKTLHDDFYLQPFIAAYKLVDDNWWDNIPDGGVLCQQMGKPSYFRVVYQSDIKKTDFKVLVLGSSVDLLNPVNDEWLESMKMGF